MASVVSNRPATDAAFWRAERTTFAGINHAGPDEPLVLGDGIRASTLTEDNLFEVETRVQKGTDTGPVVGRRHVTLLWDLALTPTPWAGRGDRPARHEPLVNSTR